MARANLLDPNVHAKKKRKQAIFLGVAFVIVLAVSVPQTMKMMNAQAPAETTAAATSPSTSTSTVPGSTTSVVGSTATGGTAQAVAATAADALVVDADLAPAPLEGQLADFTVFEAKDPFVQQKVATPRFQRGGSSTSSAAAPTKAAYTAPSTPAASSGGTTVVPVVPVAPSSTPSSSSPTPSTPTAPAAPSGATISVNGVKESVSVGADFPAAAPLFHLVKLSAKSGKISVAGGTLASGAPTVTLELGKPLTLMNTADGTRYVVILVSTGSTPAADTSTP